MGFSSVGSPSHMSHFSGQAGVGLLEQVPGRAGGPAEGALVVLLAVDDVLVAARAFGLGVYSPA